MTAPGTILVVEDNPITCKLVRFTLERERFVVVDAGDSRAACEAFVAHQPALVLLDLLLPDADGFEVFRRLRALPRGPDVPILAFTGLISEKDERRISEFGFDDIVSKPVEPARLIQIVRGYMTPSEPPAAPPPNAALRTLVVADDDAVQRKLVALRLQRAGYRVIAVADGQEALEQARAKKPFAIVSDVLMPRLDGFGLCMAVRKDPALQATPVVLISNSYLDADDKVLAKRAGADELLLRTTELRDVIALLDGDLAARRAGAPSAPVAVDPTLDRDRVARMMDQLDRQVARQSRLAQRNSLLTAELAVLSGISEAVATEHDLGAALQQVLASCFDAGGISLGALYLADGDELRGVCLGAETWSDAELASFFGARAVLTGAIRAQTAAAIPSPEYPAETHQALLDRVGVRSILIEPLGYRGSPLGALVTMSRSLEGIPADRIAFKHALAGQISLALALARTFQAKDASERAARSNAAVLRSILDSMAEGVLVGDERGAITHWNEAALSILRLEPAGGRVALDGAAHGTIVRALAHGVADRLELELEGEGNDRWLSINTRPLDDEAATGRGAVAVFRDVTVERQNAARMLVSERMASLGTLAAGVGHEINNPLMAVLGNLEMAMSDLRALRDRGVPGADEIVDVVADALEGAQRVRSIVRDLKMFSRADVETRGEVDVQRVLESSLRMVANEIRHRARLVRDFQDVPNVDANESRLSQVFVNLIVNAAQAIPEGHASDNEIRVATSVAADGRVRVDVSDTGTGMTPEIVAQIFTPFFTTKPIGVGTGLGLAICHQLVAGIGGEIVVDTTLGVGTTFSVMLPVAARVPTAATEVVVTRELPKTVSRRARILVVDDEPMVGRLIARGLSHAHDVVAMTDARAALGAIEAGDAFDVVLCDLMMPDLSGMELHALMSRVAPALATRTIFISGGAFTAEARAFLERTRNPTIDKPIEMRSLEELVAASLREGSEPPWPMKH